MPDNNRWDEFDTDELIVLREGLAAIVDGKVAVMCVSVIRAQRAEGLYAELEAEVNLRQLRALQDRYHG